MKAVINLVERHRIENNSNGKIKTTNTIYGVIASYKMSLLIFFF